MEIVQADQPLRLLLVDDEPRLTEFLSDELEDQGYLVDVVPSVSEAWQVLQADVLPEILVLDWSLPDGTGPELCERMRSNGITVPVLMLTGHDEVSDRVLALDAGVDDYLVKPFSIEELMARLRALQRRRWEAEQSAPDQLVVLGRLELNITAKTAVVSGLTLLLLNKEYELLERLMLADGRSCAAHHLLVSLWQEAGLAQPDVLDVYVQSLQSKLLAADAALSLQASGREGWCLTEVEGER